MSRTTSWPTGDDLLGWIGGESGLTAEVVAVLDELVEDATATTLDQIDEDKRPDDGSCPRPIARAIVLDAARLLSRKDSANGIVAFAEFAVRLATVDADVARLLARWGVDPEP